MRNLALVVAMAATLGGPLEAQTTVKIGTDPGATTALGGLAEISSYVSQTFVAPGPYLRSLSFWFYGGTLETPSDGPWQSGLIINSGLGLGGGPELFQVTLDQTHAGRYDFFFDDLAVVFGAPYSFTIYNTDCGSPDDLEPGTCPVPVTGVWATPSFEVTTSDAYADGYFMGFFGEPDFDRDIRFEATFTPEPSTVLLLATGLLGLGWLARKRRREHVD
jgi:hypothetical protein